MLFSQPYLNRFQRKEDYACLRHTCPRHQRPAAAVVRPRPSARREHCETDGAELLVAQGVDASSDR
jgi:hypothetical protein